MSDSLIVALLSVVIHQQGVHGLAHNAAAVTTLGKEFWGRGSKAYSSDEHTEMPKVYSYYASYVLCKVWSFYVWLLPKHLQILRF